ncbi:MAG: 50S ribosome-binding GTPase [Candidatus Bathyarchaeota archaeon]|jgi:ribosome-interacting GTPase 1|nr:50S ribosome-binding GTPase [Candidatus Bathyarchaeota archaeon]
MPTNLPPEALDKWAEVEAARGPREKMEKMQEFLKYVPQHKGTLKLRGEIKKKIAIIRNDLEEKKRKGTGKSSGGPKLFVEKEGAAQIAVLGVTNVGKSCLLQAVSNANVVVSATPFMTREPTPGIMDFGDVQFQVVETPAVMEGSGDGRAWGPVTLGVARNADGVILMVDLSHDPIGQLELLVSELEKSRVLVSRPSGRVEIDRRHAGAALRIILLGKLVDCTMREVEDLLRSYRINDAIVKISGNVTLDDVEDAIFETTTYKPALVVANKLDVTGAENNLRLLKKYVDNKLPVVAMSCEQKTGVDELGKALIEVLGIIRVYTKEPGSREPTGRPFALKRGTTVGDLAKNIHKDFVSNFLFAMVWASRLPFSPKKVGLNFVLDDGDVVELHTKV